MSTSMPFLVKCLKYFPHFKNMVTSLFPLAGLCGAVADPPITSHASRGTPFLWPLARHPMEAFQKDTFFGSRRPNVSLTAQQFLLCQ